MKTHIWLRYTILVISGGLLGILMGKIEDKPIWVYAIGVVLIFVLTWGIRSGTDLPQMTNRGALLITSSMDPRRMSKYLFVDGDIWHFTNHRNEDETLESLFFLDGRWVALSEMIPLNTAQIKENNDD